MIEMTENLVGIDLGGTRIKAIVIDKKGNILHQRFRPTNDGDDAVWKKAVADSVQEINDKFPGINDVIGISAPGLPNTENTAIGFMPGRLQGLENFMWSEFLNKKAFILNDAIASMMAEARFGAAKGEKNVIMLTLGTGVGGAILIEGKPYQGAFNKAGHIGHMTVNSDGKPDIIGIPGSLEDAIGNCTIKERTEGKFDSTDKLVEAYRNGDSFAKNIWLTSVDKLAIALASLTNILSPETIILGGGITEAGSDLFEPLKEYMAKYEWRTAGNKTQIVKAQFGEMAGAIGAACFASEKSGEK